MTRHFNQPATTVICLALALAACDREEAPPAAADAPAPQAGSTVTACALVT